MNTLNIRKTGLAVGTFAAFMHLVWSVLVALGLAESFISFAHRMHFFNTTMTVAEFSLMTAIGLIVGAGIAGFVVGSIFAFIWNKVYAR